MIKPLQTLVAASLSLPRNPNCAASASTLCTVVQPRMCGYREEVLLMWYLSAGLGGHGCYERLHPLGTPLRPDLATDVILQSLPTGYESFILNFYMNSLEKTLAELHGMLKTTEESIKKSGANHVMIIQKDRKRKRKPKAKSSDVISNPKPTLLPLRAARLVVKIHGPLLQGFLIER